MGEETGIEERAAQVAAVAGASVVTAESRRQLDADVMKSIVDAGFTRHFVPAEMGGAQGSFGELGRAVAAVGRTCTSSAWCASVVAYLGRMAAYLPRRGWAEVWADGPDTVVAGGVTPSGTARRATGGWLVSGRWAYLSAADFADWALVTGKTGADRSTARVFALPRAEFAVAQTWDAVGMQATGSNTVVAEDVFVPDHRSFPREDLVRGPAAESAAVPHTVPLPGVNGLSFALPILGAARGALDSWQASVAARLRAIVPGAPGLARVTYDVTFARAAGEIDAAELLLARVARICDRGALTPLEVVRNGRDCSLAADLLVSAVDRLFQTAGTSGQAMLSPVQRCWRDVNSARSHVALLFEPTATAYAGHLIGADGK